MHLQSGRRGSEQKLARIQLVARVMLARDQLRDATWRQGAYAAPRETIAAARSRFAALNLALRERTDKRGSVDSAHPSQRDFSG